MATRRAAVAHVSHHAPKDCENVAGVSSKSGVSQTHRFVPRLCFWHERQHGFRFDPNTGAARRSPSFMPNSAKPCFHGASHSLPMNSKPYGGSQTTASIDPGAMNPSRITARQSP